jgi:putative hydrolase of the HAD superfamily
MTAAIFDLDNTLYDVKQYFHGAFIEISEYIGNKYNLDGGIIYKDLKDIWSKKTSMYRHLFDDVLKKYEIQSEVNKVVTMFNEYECELEPYPDVKPTINKLKKMNFKLGIITDGVVERQKRKLLSLSIKDYFDEVIYTKEIGYTKPSTKPFELMLNKININPEDSYYIGDNPSIDFRGAKKVNMKTVRIKKGEFKNIPSDHFIDFEINDYEELFDFLEGN